LFSPTQSTGVCQLLRSLSLLVLALLIISLNAGILKAEDEIDDVGSRQSRHLIMPMMGYQALNSENMSFTYNAAFHLHFSGIDTVFYTSGTYNRERNVNEPVFGLVYRFRPSYQFNLDLSLGVIHDGGSQIYEAIIDLWGYKTVEKLSISRSNTTFGTADIGYNLPIPIKFLGLSVSGGIGYAWREVKSKNDRYEEDNLGTYTLTTSHLDAESIYLLRAGVDLSLWKSNQMVVMGSVFYTHFMPTDDAIDPFGGIGWKLMIFPIWSRS